MDIVEKTYVVWYWNGKDKRYRIGKVFKDKDEAYKFADTLRHWEYIGIVYSYKAYRSDD